MKVDILCPDCRADSEPYFTVELRFKNDCTYELACPQGHRFKANILYHDFQKLFEVGMTSLADDYYREALGSFAASYERFMELFIRIVLRSNGIERDMEDKIWKKMSRQSERQLGGFVLLFVLEFKEPPSLLSDDQVALRNRAVHQGYFPTKEECIKYGTAVLSLIRSAIALLLVSDKHRDALIRSINDKGDLSIEEARVHFYAYTLIGTNRPPDQETKSFDRMLQEAVQATGVRD